MKRIAALTLASVMLVSLSACGKKKVPAPTKPVEILTEASAAPETTAVPAVTQAAETYETAEDFVPQFLLDEQNEEQVRETEPDYRLPEKIQRLAEPETVYAAREVNIRMEPSVNSNSPGTLQKGEAVQRLGTSGDGWSAVLIQEDLRYIASKYLTTKAPNVPAPGSKVTETEAGDTLYAGHWVRLRQGPGADTAMLGTIPEGAKLVRIAICSNGWSKVSYGGMVGYVAGGYLTSTQPSAKPTEPPAATEPAASTTAPGKETTAPDKDGTTPSKEATEPSKDVTHPSKEATEPSKDASAPSKEATEPSKEVTQPSKEATEPSKDVTQPSKEVTAPENGDGDHSQDNKKD